MDRSVRMVRGRIKHRFGVQLQARTSDKLEHRVQWLATTLVWQDFHPLPFQQFAWRSKCRKNLQNPPNLGEARQRASR